MTPGSREDKRRRKAARAWAQDVGLDESHASLGRGAARFLSLRQFESSDACVEALRAIQGLEIWTTDLGQGAKVLAHDALWVRDKKLPKHVALVLGTESTGVSDAFHAQADERVYLPMNGLQDSLNVSVATALTLHTVLALYGPDACGDLVRDADAPISDDARPQDLRAQWAKHLARDDATLAKITASLDGGAATLDDLRRPDVLRKHNGRIRKDARKALVEACSRCGAAGHQAKTCPTIKKGQLVGPAESAPS